MTDDLVAFLSAQLNEDEAAARLCPGGHEYEMSVGYWERRTAEHALRHDPARVRADVAAKRRILERHWNREGECGWCSDERSVPWPCPDVRDVASIDANHPDYRREWRP